ncbi:hypothetical protein IWX90DRAFT_445789 [Phyllosticta citrichinensis]|uniref:Uncharacterized protein n=1 Tax=Phyllosticta citrichinensis TaxID=1130410 RepID=A0ABR1XFQ3_9PEZI
MPSRYSHLRKIICQSGPARLGAPHGRFAATTSPCSHHLLIHFTISNPDSRLPTPDSRLLPTHPCRLLAKIFSSSRSVGQVGLPLARPRPVNAPLKITISPCPPARSGRFTALPCLFFSQSSPCVCCSRDQSQSRSQSLVPLSFALWLPSESVCLFSSYSPVPTQPYPRSTPKKALRRKNLSFVIRTFSFEAPLPFVRRLRFSCAARSTSLGPCANMPSTPVQFGVSSAIDACQRVVMLKATFSKGCDAMATSRQVDGQEGSR